MELAEYIQERAHSRIAERVLGAAIVMLLVAGVVSAITAADSTRSRQASRSELRLLSDSANQYDLVTTAKMSFRFDVEGGGRRVTAVMEGVTDNQRHLGDFTMTFQGAPELPGLAAGFHLVQSGSTAFVSVPESRRHLTGGKAWVSTEAPSRAALEAATSASPTSFLELLQRDIVAGSEVLRLDDEEIRGVRTAHYRARLDLRRIAQRSGPDVPTGAQLTQLGLDEMPLDVFLDEHGVPRKTAVSVETSGLSFKVDFEMYDIGLPVDIPAPPNPDDAFHVPTLPELFRIVGSP